MIVCVCVIYLVVMLIGFVCIVILKFYVCRCGNVYVCYVLFGDMMISVCLMKVLNGVFVVMFMLSGKCMVKWLLMLGVLLIVVVLFIVLMSWLYSVRLSFVLL